MHAWQMLSIQPSHPPSELTTDTRHMVQSTLGLHSALNFANTFTAVSLPCFLLGIKGRLEGMKTGRQEDKKEGPDVKKENQELQK